MVISFVGNRFITDHAKLYRLLYDCIVTNIPQYEHITFFYGGYGAFDNLCLSVCHKIKKEKGCCEIVYITPYITEAQQRNIKQAIKNGLYDSVIYPPLERVPPKFAIIKRNEWMINQSDIVISCVRSTYGGAYKTLAFAKKRNKKIISIAELIT